MTKYITPLIASIAVVFLSGCYVSEVSYTGGYPRSVGYGHPGYYNRGPYYGGGPYYNRGPYYSRSAYPTYGQSRHFAPSRYYVPSSAHSKHKWKGHGPHGRGRR